MAPTDTERQWQIHVEGDQPVVVSSDSHLESEGYTVVRDSRGFECASGDWIEREWTGVSVLELLEDAEIPPETTHVQLESVDGYRACVPLTDLDDAIVAVGTGDAFPRFISPHALGPRNIKALAHVRPLVLAPDEDRERYEKLPIDDK